MQAATNHAILDAVMTTLESEGHMAAVFTLDYADGRPVTTGIAFCPDQHVVLFDLAKVCGNYSAANKRARVEAFVRALATEPRDPNPNAPERNAKRPRGAPVDHAALLCDETLDDDDDDEPLDDDAGYESPEPTPMSARERERILCAPEKQRP